MHAVLYLSMNLFSSEESFHYSQTPQRSGRPCFEFLKTVSRYLALTKKEFRVEKLKNQSEEPPLPLHCKPQLPQDPTVQNTQHGSHTSEANTADKVKNATGRWWNEGSPSLRCSCWAVILTLTLPRLPTDILSSSSDSCVTERHIESCGSGVEKREKGE